MYLATTIDTEEDNWGGYWDRNITFANIDRIPALQLLFDRYDIRPTYLVTWTVARDPSCVRILRRILDEGRCEIGAHLHPWNTPPFEEIAGERNSMLCNLPEPLLSAKLATLTEAIRRNFGVEPVSFRAGRWGFTRRMAATLASTGYRVDSSISPYTDWSGCHGPDHSAETPALSRISVDGNGRYLWEVPATIGFLQSREDWCSRVYRFTTGRYVKRLRLTGALYRMRLVNKVWLSPEKSDGDAMIAISRSFRSKGYRCLNLFFHSTSLLPGLGPFVRSGKDLSRFLAETERFLEHAATEGHRSITLKECPEQP